MQTVVITDGKYRSSIAAVRALGRAGYRVIVTQTRGDAGKTPPVFASRYAAGTHWIAGSVKDAAYPERLREVLRAYPRPVLFCVGAATLAAVSAQAERFDAVCDCLIAPPAVLEQLNDKAAVHTRCEELGIPVPKQYAGEPDAFPVVIKPHCGEKAGLKAAERYLVASDAEKYARCMDAMRRYDPEPIVQQRVTGDGIGVSLLLDRESRMCGAICHRRIREYPIAGGPSTCCVSFYDEKKIEQAYRLLHSFGFVGLAMVEFKGDAVLEVNPRIWGSFPLTDCTGSPIACRYVRAAAGEETGYTPCDYRTGVRMRFLLNDSASILSHLLHGHLRTFASGAADVFRAREALAAKDDPAPMRRYLRNYLPF